MRGGGGCEASFTDSEGEFGESSVGWFEGCLPCRRRRRGGGGLRGSDVDREDGEGSKESEPGSTGF